MININCFIKQDLSKTFDATFTLLIDVSASMFDKMEETIKGVVLFHETLKALNVKHEILAFNEDALTLMIENNLISLMKSFITISIMEKSGPRIMSLHLKMIIEMA